MRYQPADKDLYIKNRKKLTALLPAASMAVIHSGERLIRNGENYYPFRQRSDFFYLTGTDQEDSTLLIWKHPGGNGYDEAMFIIRPDKKMETWEGQKMSFKETEQLSGIRTVRWQDDFETVFHEIAGCSEKIFVNAEVPGTETDRQFSPVEDGARRRGGYESSIRDINVHPGTSANAMTGISLKHLTGIKYRDRQFAELLRLKYPAHKLENMAPLLGQLRLVKEPEEIEMVRTASAVTRDAFLNVLNFIRAGMKEYEAEAVITWEFLRRGASGHAFQPIMASGPNACVLHYTRNDGICREGDLLLMDFGAEYGNYASDCSRTIPVSGKFSERQREIYLAVLKILRKATRLMVPGSTIAEIQLEVCRFLEKEHVKLGLYSRHDLKNQDPDNMLVTKYFPHGVSHFMGLDVHDVGEKTIKLKPGMILTCEPGIYIPGEGIGIRLENDILITEKGPVDLMADIPVEPSEIEGLLVTGRTSPRF